MSACVVNAPSSEAPEIQALTFRAQAGIGAQQIANDPGGTRWTRHVETMVGLVVDRFPRVRTTP